MMGLNYSINSCHELKIGYEVTYLIIRLNNTPYGIMQDYGILPLTLQSSVYNS